MRYARIFNETFNAKKLCSVSVFFYFFIQRRIEEITNSHPRDSSVRNLVCAVLDGAFTIEGHWFKAILKRGSLNNTINLMSFAGQSGEGEREFFLREGFF